jgi:hypothetical protein
MADAAPAGRPAETILAKPQAVPGPVQPYYERTPMSTPTCPPAPAWIGWRRVTCGRSRGKWEPVVAGTTERECSDKLFRLLTGSTGHADTCVLPVGEEP